MRKFSKLLCLILSVLMLFATFTACKTNSDDDTSDDGGTSTDNVSGAYQVTVNTAGGMALEGVDVYVYADAELKDMEDYGKTDANGKVSFNIEKNSNYAITLDNLPNGYKVEKSYKFNDSSANIVLTSAPVQGEDLSDAVLKLGDIIYDFTVTDAEGNKIVLSDVLKSKKLVVLNFWYTTCSWCMTEFPIMNEVYQNYAEDVEIIALNPMESAATVQTFDKQNGFAFPMAACPSSWANTFEVSGYPTSVFIDRYGVICLVEAGAITTKRPFINAFEHFVADKYEQKLCTSVGELVTNVVSEYKMESSEVIGNTINSGNIDVTYRPESGEDAEFAWPFLTGDKDGVKCIYASNKEIEGSFSIIYADISLKAGQAIGFDYFSSCEANSDILYVLINREDIYQISGNAQNEWESCFPWVAEEDGVYELALCYMKDDSTNEGDDTVYISNMRVIDSKEITTPTYIPRFPFKETETAYEYEEIFFNDNDGYYHIGNVNGPLLLANLMNPSEFNEDKSVYDMTSEGLFKLDGNDYTEEITSYCTNASNSALNGYCTVNARLAELLKIVAEVAGFENNDNEWLKICKYYASYGSNGKELEDPIKGLTTYSAYEATLGKNVPTNVFYYDRALLPRGYLAKFTPNITGVYRITSRNESIDGVEAWIYNDKQEVIFTYEADERMFTVDGECSIVFYMEAGKNYYIDIAFWDLYNVGYIYYDIEYLGAKYNLFRSASPGYFTYDSNATGDNMYYVIGGGIKVIFGNDGYYHHDLGIDANGNQKLGSIIYADFVGTTSIFSTAISTVYAYDENGNIKKDENGNPVMIEGIVDKGGFDFSKTEDDLYILSFLEKFNGDTKATQDYLKELWGDTYDEYYEAYKVKDVFAGKYHGSGDDLTDEAKVYLDKIITGGKPEENGCVPVDEKLASLLQLLMDKYTFQNVDDAWLKLCYYYDYMG